MLSDAVVIDTGPEPKAAVVWLHGLGADGHDFEPIVPQLRLPQTRFVFPHAPLRPVTLNGGMVMRAWYDIPSLELRSQLDLEGLKESGRLVNQLLREVWAEIPPQRTVLAGFSQGGALTYYSGLRHPARMAGFLVLSGYCPNLESLEEERHPANQETPILQCHGSFDQVVPLQLGAFAAETLKRKGYSVDWRSYPTQHSLHHQELKEIGVWLRERLPEVTSAQ